MSWKGFTKAINRLPTIIAQSTGSNKATQDPEFSNLEEQFKQVDVLARKLSQDTKKFKDSLSLMLHHQAELASLLTAIYMPLEAVITGDIHSYKEQQSGGDTRVKSAIEVKSFA
jgi:amphiphysin